MIVSYNKKDDDYLVSIEIPISKTIGKRLIVSDKLEELENNLQYEFKDAITNHLLVCTVEEYGKINIGKIMKTKGKKMKTKAIILILGILLGIGMGILCQNFSRYELEKYEIEKVEMVD